jgi:predicted molibdopterin-dependent oxidoreductase YjgC
MLGMDAIAGADMLGDVAHDLRIAGIARPAPVSFTFEGTALTAPAGESLAAALLAAGIRRLGEGADPARPRTALCMMGVCQQCLVRVDGRLAQACLRPVSAGMVVTAA